MTKSLLAAVALKTKNLFLAASHFCDWCRKFSNKFFLSFFVCSKPNVPGISSADLVMMELWMLNIGYVTIAKSNASYLWRKRYCTCTSTVPYFLYYTYWSKETLTNLSFEQLKKKKSNCHWLMTCHGHKRIEKIPQWIK